MNNNPDRFFDRMGLAGSGSNDENCNKENCIKKCSELALPTTDYGVAFHRCLQTCMGIQQWPEWKKYFPVNEQEQLSPDKSQAIAKAAIGASASVGLTWAIIETIGGFALAF